MSDRGATGTLCEVAQLVKGLAWLVPGPPRNLSAMSQDTMIAATNLSYFENPNFPMKLLPRNKVSFRYKFKDFRGTNAVPAPWEGLLETRCRHFQPTQNLSLPLASANFTKYPLTAGSHSYRWISPNLNFTNGTMGTYIPPRQGKIQVCKLEMHNRS